VNIPKYTVLIVEDDKLLVPVLLETLQHLSQEVYVAFSGEEALDYLRKGLNFDLILSDINLPDINGLDLLKLMRQETPRTPVLFLSARSEETDVVLGLELGAEDYIVKPFRARELVARVKKILTRTPALVGASTRPTEAQQFLVFPHLSLRVDTHSREVRVKGKILEFTRKEFDILILLLQHPRQIFSRKHILEQIWNDELDVSDRVVDSHVSHIRTKIGACEPEFPACLRTIRGIGYQFKPPQEK
jgi:DNA-binding response OmpR family regulator